MFLMKKLKLKYFLIIIIINSLLFKINYLIFYANAQSHESIQIR